MKRKRFKINLVINLCSGIYIVYYEFTITKITLSIPYQWFRYLAMKNKTGGIQPPDKYHGEIIINYNNLEYSFNLYIR